MIPAPLVLESYRAITSLYWPLAVLHHLVLGVVLWFVVSGMKRPGLRLMTLAFASMAFSVMFVTAQYSLSFPTISFLVLLLCVLYDVAKPLTDWHSGAGKPAWERRCAWFALGWAWVYPHNVAWWKALLASPLGILPSPTLMALLALLWLAFPQTNRLLHWAAATLGVLFGLHGLLILRIPSDLILLALAGWTLRFLIQSARQAGGLLEEDLTPREKPKPAPARTKKDQVWKI